MNADTCVSCGAQIPEGRQTCPACEARAQAAGGRHRLAPADWYIMWVALMLGAAGGTLAVLAGYIAYGGMI